LKSRALSHKYVTDVVLIYVRYKILVFKPFTQELGVTIFSFDQEQRQISMSQMVYLIFAERSASQARIRESQMSLQIFHHNKCDWNFPLKTDIFVFKFFHYLDGQFWVKVIAELIFKNKKIKKQNA
jgi:hypothetical protein